MKYLLIILLLASCYSVKKAENQIDKVYNNYPEVVAKKTSIWFPCGATIQSIDSTDLNNYIKQVDSLNSVVNSLTIFDTLPEIIYTKDCKEYKAIIDSLQARINKAKQVIIKIKTIASKPAIVTKTILISDTAKLYFLNSEIVKYRELADKYEGKYQFWLKVCLWGLIALIISLIINFIKR
jgi:lysozyme family protein